MVVNNSRCWAQIRLGLAIALASAAAAGSAAAADRHAGYYYPTPSSTETYVARAVTMTSSSRAQRILFATQLTNQMLESPHAPTFALFPKGEKAEKLIITSLQAGRYDTVYRMRALLAQLTAKARQTMLFRQYQVEDEFTFLDLLKLLGFVQLTVTDGDKLAHQIVIQ